jgi:hypothetical protein
MIVFVVTQGTYDTTPVAVRFTRADAEAVLAAVDAAARFEDDRGAIWELDTDAPAEGFEITGVA